MSPVLTSALSKLTEYSMGGPRVVLPGKRLCPVYPVHGF